VTLPGIPVFFGLSLVWPDPDHHWWDGLVGIAVGYGVIWVIDRAYYQLTKREGIGLGDAKFLALVGALMGWKGVIASLFGGAMIGSVLGIAGILVQRARKKPAEVDPGEDGEGEAESLMKTELPFGPFLAAAALLYLLAQPWLAVNVSFGG